jgi:hypothetical protein
LATASGTANYAFYVIASGKINLMQIDAAPSTALAGVAEMQSTEVFNVSSVEGGYTFLLEQPAVVGSGGNPDLGEFNKVGFWSFDGEGTLVSGLEDDDKISNPITGLTGEYAVSGLINGRGTLQDTTPSMLTRTYVFYMVSPSKLYVLESFKDSKVAPIGVAERQSDQPYSQATLSGSYALDASEVTETCSEILMQLMFDAKGGVGGIADWSCKGAVSGCPNGPVSSTAVAPLYSPINPNPDPAVGRGVLGIPNSVGAGAYVFYLTNSNRAWILGAPPDSDVDGRLTRQ